MGAAVHHVDASPKRTRSHVTRHPPRPSHGRAEPAAARARAQPQAPAARDGRAPEHGAMSQRAPPRRPPKPHDDNDDERAPDYDVPASWGGLDELAGAAPVQNVDEGGTYKYENLEDARRADEDYGRGREDEEEEEVVASRGRACGGAREKPQTTTSPPARGRASRLATQLYTISYLILFSLLGTLARLGLQALTNYAGAPVFPSVWFNFGGSVVMGFLTEDRMLFRNEWGTPTYEQQIRTAKKQDEERAGSDAPAVDLAAAKKAHLAVKKTIPLYVGMATGFCGSFTSFSSFIRDMFLALSNDLPQPGLKTTVPRSGGDSLMALLAVLIITVSASLSGLLLGAHLALAAEPLTPTLPRCLTRRVLDPLAVLLGWGGWAAAVALLVRPPRRDWRGVATAALALAPLGTLARFYAALWLNGRRPSFPLGTFAANVLGAAALAAAWDLQRAPLLRGGGGVGGVGVVGCQVLQGVEDGLCGCLTTVSTWVSELAALRRRHAWRYGAASVLVSFGLMVAIMGGLRWTEGFAALQCAH